MSIFGDETITIPGSPDESGQDEGAAGTAGNDESFEDEKDYGDDADLGDEGEQDDEQSDDDEQDSPPVDGQGDGLILGKFKTDQDLAKAYLNLEREFTKLRMGGGQQPGQTQVVQQPPAQPGQQGDPKALFWERFRDDPLATMEMVVSHLVGQQTAPIHEARRSEVISGNLQKVAQEYRQAGTEEGLAQLFDKVKEIAEEVGNPDLLRNPPERILRLAAREAFGDTAAKAFQKGKEAGRSESERTRASKAGAGVHAGGKGSKQAGNEVKTPEQSMKEAILAAGKGGGGIFG